MRTFDVFCFQVIFSIAIYASWLIKLIHFVTLPLSSLPLPFPSALTPLSKVSLCDSGWAPFLQPLSTRKAGVCHHARLGTFYLNDGSTIQFGTTLWCLGVFEKRGFSRWRLLLCFLAGSCFFVLCRPCGSDIPSLLSSFSGIPHCVLI